MMSPSALATALTASDTVTTAECVSSVNSCISHLAKKQFRQHRRHSMPKHERFEKLCSLAALGEVTPEEMIELHDHLRGCARCKITLADFSSIIDDRLPLADPGRARVNPEVSSDGLRQLRESTLKRVAGEGLHVSQDAFRGPNSRILNLRDRLNEFSWSVRARLPRIAVSTAVLAMVVVGTGLVHHEQRQKEEATRLQNELRQAREVNATVAQRL